MMDTMAYIIMAVVRTFMLLLALHLIFPAIILKVSMWFGCLLIVLVLQGIALQVAAHFTAAIVRTVKDS